MKFRLTFLASLLGLVSACSPQASAAPTPLPPDYLPTVVALTGQAAFATASAMPPEFTPTVEALTTPTPTLEIPSPTPTLAAGFTEYAQIRFLSPGPMSSLTSPFIMNAIIASGESDKFQVDLLGEDGRVLQRFIQKLGRNPLGVFQRFEFTYEIRAVSEAGYIRVSTKDDFGRMQALNTLPVLLYSAGTPQVTPPGNIIYERIAMDGFKEKQPFFGGEVPLKGRIWPYNDQPFVVELISKEGKPLGSRILGINGIDTQPFETVIPYKVGEPTPARLTFRQDNPLLALSDPELGKLVYLYTIEVILNP
ncbi:MAG: hypothetical protein DCC59_04790 [Chloroflexi bacterium]|nr:hypothetical protein [Anaerolineales bacterium]MCQ3953779.1 hypothetical protein [Chloroflexota bacterium]MDL1920390.1 hypothetical protein [Chloroflexi bacterium CFX5]NUQ58871.1 hypothetical protein [Anaerolineales bacterium]RIK54207.1 MAG: hypothetical protein DCC59_04790 [Chloroflexota bacterium]